MKNGKHKTMSKTREISCEELVELLSREQKPILLDVLPRSHFRHSHLPGALSLPVDEMTTQVAHLLPNKTVFIVVYCQNPSCPAAQEAIQILINLGFQNVFYYSGGKDDWRTAGLLLEGESRRLKFV